MVLGYEEPFWNDNSGLSGPDNFPFNENVLLPGTVAYNERSISAGLSSVQSLDGNVSVNPVTISDDNLPQPNRWNHACLGIGNTGISLFLNGRQKTISRISSGFGGNMEININPQQVPIVMD